MTAGLAKTGVARRRRGGRRPASEGNHAARISILELRFPKGMRARCSWCNSVAAAADGRWLEVLFSSPGSGVVSGRVFQCRACQSSAAYTGGTGLVTVPRPSEAAGAVRASVYEDEHDERGEPATADPDEQSAGFGMAG